MPLLMLLLISHQSKDDEVYMPPMLHFLESRESRSTTHEDLSMLKLRTVQLSF